MIEALLAERLFDPEPVYGPGVVLVEDGQMLAAGARRGIEIPARARVHDFGDAALVPGLLDVHVHGGAGHDFMAAGPHALDEIRQHLARHGVTHFLATTMSAPWAAVLEAIGRLADAGLDIHMEGPFLSPARRGAHAQCDLLEPTLDRLQQVWERGQGRLKLITLAPELAGAVEFIREATARGIVIGLGHSDATREQAQAAVQAGARHVTHTFNAMRPLHQREPGLLGEALTNSHLSAEIIADGHHVDPLLVEMFLRLKGRERTVLVSDGISATGCGEGEFPLGGHRVQVKAGMCLLQGTLAGSVLTLDRALRNLEQWAGLGLHTTLPYVTRNPARLLGYENKGRLRAGADADVTVLGAQGEVMACFRAGSGKMERASEG